jgi:hypothetical protein
LFGVEQSRLPNYRHTFDIYQFVGRAKRVDVFLAHRIFDGLDCVAFVCRVMADFLCEHDPLSVECHRNGNERMIARGSPNKSLIAKDFSAALGAFVWRGSQVITAPAVAGLCLLVILWRWSDALEDGTKNGGTGEPASSKADDFQSVHHGATVSWSNSIVVGTHDPLQCT